MTWNSQFAALGQPAAEFIESERVRGHAQRSQRMVRECQKRMAVTCAAAGGYVRAGKQPSAERGLKTALDDLKRALNDTARESAELALLVDPDRPAADLTELELVCQHSRRLIRATQECRSRLLVLYATACGCVSAISGVKRLHGFHEPSVERGFKQALVDLECAIDDACVESWELAELVDPDRPAEGITAIGGRWSGACAVRG